MPEKKSTELALLTGVELVKFIFILALQEARRSKMTAEETDAALVEARAQFEKNVPENIPDV